RMSQPQPSTPTGGRLMAVAFERHGQLHYLDPGARDYAVGDHVLYPTERGPEVCQVVWAPEPSSDELTGKTLPLCPGPASQADLERDAAMRRRRAEVTAVAKAMIAERGLGMRVLAVDVIDRGDDPLVAIHYTAPERVDFRTLVGPLARAVGSRVDLRHIGSRESARITGGVGHCGRELCCSTFLRDLEPISMRVAKEQNLPPNPLQIAGACGRLMCCLTYEHPLYVDFAERAPAIGARVETEAGQGVVVGQHPPSQTLVVRTGATVTRCPLVEVCTTHRARADRSRRLAQNDPAPVSTYHRPRPRNT
uniref:PSP1 domain-containing protein n=1 Tax=Aestuariimicrobium ganziense TaxID=2773677 RepID=UPI00194471A5